MLKYFNRNYLDAMPKVKDSSILDVGCGRGYYINALKQNGYNNVSGIDLSPSNVEFCKSQGYDVLNIDMFDFLLSKPSVYDVIILNDVLEHLYKDEIMTALDLMRGALKRGGLLIVKTINPANPYVSCAGRYIALDHEIAFTERRIQQTLLAVGFSDICIKALDIYVVGGPIAWIAKLLSKLICLRLRMYSTLFGRKSIKIFTKSIIAFARK